jgi:riboflavin synthase
MFTGIISAVGRIESSMPLAEGVRLAIAAGSLDLSDVAIGDSIAVNGVCLTVVACHPPHFEVDVSRVTLEATQGLETGARVNLEKALRLSDRLGGHLVTGHVDGTGIVEIFEPRGESWHLGIRAPGDLPRYLARKGSVTVNGVSLTVNEVRGDFFEANIIPHTREATTFSFLKAGDRVNLEVDLLARYAERARQWEEGSASI